LGSAKDILLRPIERREADALVKRVHYSGKVVNNSQIHIGVFYQGKLEGAMQFGPSLDKRKIQPLVSGTLWNEFIELNRMAFSDALPRNSESRALGVAMRILRKHAPHLKWVVSFADGAQCGDGTIYRAAGFVLTGIKENTSIWEAPSGDQFSDHALRNVDGHNKAYARAQALARGEAGARFSRTSLTDNRSKREQEAARAIVSLGHSGTGHDSARGGGGASMRQYIEAGFKPIPGFQLRYIYFLDPSARERLTVSILPFSEIERRGAGMYKGTPRAGSIVADAPAIHAGEDGAVPIPALQTAL
jgi:hypothetical protein